MRGSCFAIAISLLAAGITACNSQSEIDTGFLGNPTSTNATSFDQTFTFNAGNTSSYTFNSSSIQFTGGVAELIPASQTDDGDVTEGFAGGSSTGTAWSAATDGDGGSDYVMLSQTGAATDLELDSSWTPAWSSLGGYWKLNGTLGSVSSGSTVSDSSGNGANGTVSGTGASYVSGKLNQGLSVANSYTGYAVIPSSVAPNPCSMITVVFWWNGTSPPEYGNLLESTDGTTTFYNVQTYTSGTLYLTLNTGGSAQDLYWNSNDNFFDGNWHQVAFTLKSGTATMYKDGILDTSSTYTVGSGLCHPSSSLYIGGNVPGTFDDLAIWNTALSASAIATIYQHESAAHAGTYQSRVMDGLATGQNWTSAAMMTTLPYGKELPDGGSSESSSSYSSQSASLMSGIVGLWHLDEPSMATAVIDASGNGNNGAPTNVTLGGAGLLGTSASFNGTSSEISVPTTSALTPASMTISVWEKPSSLPAKSGVAPLVSKWGGGVDGYSLELYNQSGTQKIDFAGAGAGTLATYTSPVDQWTNIALVFSGSAKTATIYVNGVKSVSDSTPDGLTDYSTPFLIGARTIGGYFFNGSIDEVALWNRALTDGSSGTPNEILELYRRGADRVRYQVRSCSDSTCTTGSPSWLGPDGTNQTYFSELNNNAVPSDGGDLSASDSVLTGSPTMTFTNFGSPLSTNLTSNRYFQYRAIMESDDTGTGCDYGSGATWCSPELQSVSAAPAHYDSSAPTLANNSGVGYQTLSGFAETLGPDDCPSGTYYDISPDGSNWYYWTGAAWGLADGTSAKANLASVIGANLPAFVSQVGAGSLYFRVFMESSGTTPCELSSVEITGTH